MANNLVSGHYRQKLYFAAMVATRQNPDIKVLYERLLAADKTKMCALWCTSVTA
jgi:hypothetical protein